jgi:hypothetical protein
MIYQTGKNLALPQPLVFVVLAILFFYFCLLLLNQSIDCSIESSLSLAISETLAYQLSKKKTREWVISPIPANFQQAEPRHLFLVLALPLLFCFSL